MNENNLNTDTQTNDAVATNNTVNPVSPAEVTNPVVQEQITNTTDAIIPDGKNVPRFLLTFFLGWIGSFIINHTSLKPQGYKSRTTAYFFLTFVTLGIYPLVASFCNLGFNPNKQKNIGYLKEM